MGIEGLTSQEVSEATIAFKEKAMAGGAKYTGFRSSTKIRGDDTLDTTFVIYDNLKIKWQSSSSSKQILIGLQALLVNWTLRMSII